MWTTFGAFLGREMEGILSVMVWVGPCGAMWEGAGVLGVGVSGERLPEAEGALWDEMPRGFSAGLAVVMPRSHSFGHPLGHGRPSENPSRFR